VVIVDVGKGVIGAGLVPGLELPFVPADPAISRTWLTLCCSAAAVFGHVWPVYHRFRGGKGAATLVGTLIVLGPLLLVPLLLVWALVFILSGYVGLATMSAAVAVPVTLAIGFRPEDVPLIFYCAVMAGFVIRWHRSNIQRMRAGTENRVMKAMLFRARRGTTGDEQP
jgi:glycerol-3-phosphate acyltransferase PlsY